MLPLRTELAMTFTALFLLVGGDGSGGQGSCVAGRCAVAAPTRSCRPPPASSGGAGPEGFYGFRVALVAPERPRRPPPVPCGARAHRQSAAPLLRRARFCRGRNRRPAGVARQRGPPAR